MNKSDSERIAACLKKLGFRSTRAPNKADLVVLNTCSVRQSCEDRVYGTLSNLQKQKRQNSKLIIALTGCMIFRCRKKLEEKVDIIFDIKDLPKFSTILISKFPSITAHKNAKSIKNLDQKSYFHISPLRTNKFHAFVPIMTGCNNFCSYCVVPYTRGREYCRPADEIICEVKNLVKRGYKAITLLGQNVNSYKDYKFQNSKVSEINFPTLLKLINAIPGNFWIWFVTSHPKDMSDELITEINSCKKVCPYIHLPVQAGNNEILKAMNRGYSREYYIKLVQKIRQKIPHVAISTDTICGFPGETKKQFQDTVSLYKKIKFDMAYIARYSERSGTKAAKLKDNVPVSEKKRREKILTSILKKTALENNQKLVGNTVEVLVEKITKGHNLLGKTKTFKTVKFKGNCDLVGKIVKIKITNALEWGLKGKLLNC